ncbi:hypothetical protein [Terrarubrum flagellatum]|uniref:hypothetical protein n=1 Tax=Terrirubrum flagellatum TaxID=2895980 RepID=UPI003144EE5C
MGSTTYFVVIPFAEDEEGDLCALEPIEARNPSNAIFKARDVGSRNAGAVAFSRSGDLNLGEFDDAVILARVGKVPDDLAGLAGE